MVSRAEVLHTRAFHAECARSFIEPFVYIFAVQRNPYLFQRRPATLLPASLAHLVSTTLKGNAFSEPQSLLPESPSLLPELARPR